MMQPLNQLLILSIIFGVMVLDTLTFSPGIKKEHKHKAKPSLEKKKNVSNVNT